MTPFVLLSAGSLASAAAQDVAPGTQLGSARLNPSRMVPHHAGDAVRHAGIYHVSTATWTRRPSQVGGFGPDIVYSNTAWSGYYTDMGAPAGFAPGSLVTDEGGLPSSSNPLQPLANRDEYCINGFQLGYCDPDPTGATAGWEISFYSDRGLQCTTPPAATHTVTVTGLPTGGCWTLDIDLTGAEFDLAADAGDGFDNDPNLDSFGWSYRYAGSNPAARGGMMISGDPEFTDPGYVPGATTTGGEGTYYGPASLCASGATGYLTGDFSHIESPDPNLTRCFFWGGYRNNNGCGGAQSNPYANFHMQLAADLASCGLGPIGDVYCTSNPNSTGVVSALAATGSTSVTRDRVALEAAVPPQVFGFFLVSPAAGLTPNPGGSAGILCLSGAIGRFVGPGQIKFSGSAGSLALDTAVGEWSLAGLPSPTGSVPAVPGMTSYFQAWHRDSQGGSNLTEGRRLTWTP